MQVALIIPAVLVPTAVIQAPTLIGSTKTPHAPTAFIPIIGKIIVPNEALQLSVVHPPTFCCTELSFAIVNVKSRTTLPAVLLRTSRRAANGFFHLIPAVTGDEIIPHKNIAQIGM